MPSNRHYKRAMVVCHIEVGAQSSQRRKAQTKSELVYPSSGRRGQARAETLALTTIPLAESPDQDETKETLIIRARHLDVTVTSTTQFNL